MVGKCPTLASALRDPSPPPPPPLWVSIQAALLVPPTRFSLSKEPFRAPLIQAQLQGTGAVVAGEQEDWEACQDPGMQEEPVGIAETYLT